MIDEKSQHGSFSIAHIDLDMGICYERRISFTFWV